MEKNRKPIKRKVKRKNTKKFKCELCERLVMNHNHVKTRKNYPFGKKSKPIITITHRKCGGCLVELKRKNDRKI